MHTSKRQHEVVVIDRLLDAPYRYQFAQLVSILLRMLRQQGVSYEQAFSQVLRFRNSLSLTFPASEIESLVARDGSRIHITPAFIGLLGSTGTLPLHDTERAIRKAMEDQDESWHAFMDLFSNRIVGLFYEAWGKYRVEHGLNTRGQDALMPMLIALGGAAGKQGVAAEVRAYYAALLGTRPIAASTVERVLVDYFAVPIRLEEFAGAWDPIPQHLQSTFGVTKPRLGFGAVLGTRVWRNDRRVRLHIGPLTERQAMDFLQHGEAGLALREMVELFAVPSVQYEVRLNLDATCIGPLHLTAKVSDGKKLGWTTFLTSTPGKAERAVNSYILRLRSLDNSQHAEVSS